MEKQFDAVVIFDADNVVHLDFLMEMNSRLCKGERLIQGYLDAKNQMILGFPVFLLFPSGLLTIFGILPNTILAYQAF